MVFAAYHSLHNIQSHSLQYGIRWTYGTTKAVRPYLPLTNDAMPITVNGKQRKRMHHDGYYDSNHLFFVESHKCATDNRILIPEAKRMYRTEHSVQRHSCANPSTYDPTCLHK